MRTGEAAADIGLLELFAALRPRSPRRLAATKMAVREACVNLCREKKKHVFAGQVGVVSCCGRRASVAANEGVESMAAHQGWEEQPTVVL